MRFIVLALLLLSLPAISESRFDANYLQLEKKIEALKDKGEKISDKTRKELEDLMVQMNHEHAELKRELEKKNQELNQKVNQTIFTGKDWTDRIAAAWHEVADGFARAWGRIRKDSQQH